MNKYKNKSSNIHNIHNIQDNVNVVTTTINDNVNTVVTDVHDTRNMYRPVTPSNCNHTGKNIITT